MTRKERREATEKKRQELLNDIHEIVTRETQSGKSLGQAIEVADVWLRDRLKKHPQEASEIRQLADRYMSLLAKSIHSLKEDRSQNIREAVPANCPEGRSV